MTQTMSVEPFKVMVVGDAAPARHALIAILRAGGFVAEHGDGPDNALDAIRQRDYDVALFDIENLTGTSARELCQNIPSTGK